jgi:simple sugar transport system permease protein/ribose transport system permease protein
MSSTTPADTALESDDRVESRILFPVIVGIAVLALLVLGWATTPAFTTTRNFLNIVRAASIIGMIAVTMTFITIAGSLFSLSVVQTAALSAIGFAAALSWGWPWPLAMLAILALAALIGLVQGVGVAAGGNPIVVTLAFGAVLFGLGAVLSGNKTVRTGSDVVEWFGTGRPFGIPNQTYAFILLTIIAAVILTKTRFGRNVTLVGANRDAALASGLSPARVAVAVFVISAVGAAIAGMFTSAQFSQGRLDQFDGFDIDAIAAILVGGASIQGGEGSMIRTALGAVFIAGLQNLMVLRGYSFGVRMFWVGMAILAGVSLFTVLRNRSRTA